MSKNENDKFYKHYNLVEARNHPSNFMPAEHQHEAIGNLISWFKNDYNFFKGGILVLPTGGGKTFTAIRFLSESPLSKGYKVLWLAHTHHLLEQAYYSFGSDWADEKIGYEVGHIKGPREKLDIRVVSGTKNHYNVKDILTTDDVLISTLQTISSANKRRDPNLEAFFDSAGDDLFVVFDEAHHSPAPSYRNLLLELRERFANMCLLGLTATPTYSNQKKVGWLDKLFPQNIIYQISLNNLMSQRILARPNFEKPKRTNFEPTFNDAEYKKWVHSYRDLPEHIIDQLAQNRDRNLFIAKTYANDPEHYGKTLIFADRKEQCVQIAEFIRQEGFRANYMFSGIYQKSKNGKRHGGDKHNIKALSNFKNGDLDVLVNIRMLTEGTDVPDVDSVFLTRQTTSQILLTQMVGRALRGPNFNGTEDANIVSFVDEWQHKINWAEWYLGTGPIEPDKEIEYEPIDLKWFPLYLIEQLSRSMYEKNGVQIEAFLKSVPIGWYQANFYALADDSDDYESMSRLLMVFEDEKKSYERFIDQMIKQDLSDYQSEEIKFQDKLSQLEELSQEYFDDNGLGTSDILNNIFYINCHLAQNDYEKPIFFDFKERDNHDIDKLAREYMSLNILEANTRLQEEYVKKDRYWNTIYPNYQLFKQQFDACVNRLLNIRSESKKIAGINSTENPEKIRKDNVKKRDENQCLACGESDPIKLDVDIIDPQFIGAKNSLDNQQTLCQMCNRYKSKNIIDFRSKQTFLLKPPKKIPDIQLPSSEKSADTESWIQYLKRILNFFYESNSIKAIKINEKSWTIELYPDNNPNWIKPFIEELQNTIISRRSVVGLEGPDEIIVV